MEDADFGTKRSLKKQGIIDPGMIRSIQVSGTKEHDPKEC
ncbi:hypothetical protein JOC55_002456 [Paenibacillus sacheonensis]|nr:hypothetical protein [Paenibacillus sacheonensis]